MCCGIQGSLASSFRKRIVSSLGSGAFFRAPQKFRSILWLPRDSTLFYWIWRTWLHQVPCLWKSKQISEDIFKSWSTFGEVTKALTGWAWERREEGSQRDAWLMQYSRKIWILGQISTMPCTGLTLIPLKSDFKEGEEGLLLIAFISCYLSVQLRSSSGAQSMYPHMTFRSILLLLLMINSWNNIHFLLLVCAKFVHVCIQIQMKN